MTALSIKDKIKAFKRATQSFSGSRERWLMRSKTGLTDEELEEALRYELGICGGSSGRDHINVTYQRSGLKIWVQSRVERYSTKSQPTFQGKHTMEIARQVYNVANPDDRQISLFQ